MLQQQHIFLKLLCQSIRKEKDFELNVKLEEDEWKQLGEMASAQHVFPLIYDAICRTEIFQEIPEQIRGQWRKMVSMGIIAQARKTKAFLNIYNKMTAAGIEGLVVKGIICRSLYSNPDYRPSGDEDILIPRGQFKKCDEFLLENGFIRNDIDIDNPDYEVSYVNMKLDLRIEIHLSLMPEDVLAFSRLNAEFTDIFENRQEIVFEGTVVYAPDYTSHLLYLLCHSYKHFIFRGFGLRQLGDMMLMAEQYGDVIDWKYIIEASKKYHMDVFFANLLDIAERYLGFDRQKSGCPDFSEGSLNSENLLEDMLDAGIYGRSGSGREHSTNITISAVENDGKRGNSFLKRALFPPKEYMQQQYPYVKKHTWLLPAAWIQRMFRYRKEIQNSKKKGEEDVNSIEVGRKRVELLEQYGIIQSKK